MAGGRNELCPIRPRLSNEENAFYHDPVAHRGRENAEQEKGGISESSASSACHRIEKARGFVTYYVTCCR